MLVDGGVSGWQKEWTAAIRRRQPLEGWQRKGGMAEGSDDISDGWRSWMAREGDDGSDGVDGWRDDGISGWMAKADGHRKVPDGKLGHRG